MNHPPATNARRSINRDIAATTVSRDAGHHAMPSVNQFYAEGCARFDVEWMLVSEQLAQCSGCQPVRYGRQGSPGQEYIQIVLLKGLPVPSLPIYLLRRIG